MSVQERICDNLWNMFHEMKCHANNYQSNFICSNDDKRLLIGWFCVKTECYFGVRLSGIRTRKAMKLPINIVDIDIFSNEEKDLAYDVLSELIIDQKGRTKIAKLMSWSGQNNSAMHEFHRLIKLKAFW